MLHSRDRLLDKNDSDGMNKIDQEEEKVRNDVIVISELRVVHQALPELA